jgi:hypothetical protein
MTRIDIINGLIKKHKYKSYLEIGIESGSCFNHIVCENKTAVDPDKKVLKNVPSAIIKTSNDFFVSNKEKFDIIFIDGLHHSGQVYIDIISSINCLIEGGTIVCHDMLPPNEKAQIVPRQQSLWTGDCWKAWVLLRTYEADLSMFVVDTDFGCGVIQKGSQELIEKPYKDFTYLDFVKHKDYWMNIISVEGFKKILEKDL